MKKLLVTGGAGFIGSNFVKYLAEKYSDILIVNLDALTYAGNLKNLESLKDDPRHIFVKGSITDGSIVCTLFEKYGFDGVVNFAAETHVDRSIREPDTFVKTNVSGTLCLLDCALKAWQLGKDAQGYPSCRNGVKFLQVSTDEVYGALGKEGRFIEGSPLAPSSPYSASKASADLLVQAYAKTYRLPVNITRSSNNYGPYQFPEKLVPLMIGNALEEKPLPVYGDGMQIRDWLFVHDNCSAIDAVLRKGIPGEIYNIGASNEKTNIEIIKLILCRLGKPESLIRHIEDRPGHDARYAIDSSKIESELGWRPQYDFKQGIADTIDWYLDNLEWLQDVRSGEYLNYYTKYYPGCK